ncbi:hypothetical protein CPC08DRAFT_772937 [Agrocybe pediades]|nr:hypothetical protein CPC08DRAFT_772937 [Agrocybe pediades]
MSGLPIPPSFSSFPDFEQGSSQEPSRDASANKSTDDKKRKKRRHSNERKSGSDRTHKRDKHKHKDKDRHRSPSRKERRVVDDKDVPYSQRDEAYEQTKHLFYSDRKGDIKNIHYGKLHTGDIPKYRMVVGGRNVLGLRKPLVVLRRSGGGVEIGVNDFHRKAPDLSSSSSRALLSKPPSKRIVAVPGNQRYEEVDGVIRFPTRREGEDAIDSYRSITAGREHDDSDYSSDSGSDSSPTSDEDSGHITLTAHQETLARLQQEVDVKPDDVNAWMALLTQTLTTIPITSKNASKARSEITASILSRALAASAHNATNKVLRLAYLKAGEEVWHDSKLRAEWDDALKVGGIEILMEWLEWAIRNTRDGIEGITNAALQVLSRLASGVEAEVSRVRVFWRVAAALRSAGYHERATAMFQVQAELSFNTPASLLGTSFDKMLAELESFWDSEAPRIGEDNASGWASWYHAKDTQPPATASRNVQDLSYIIDLDPYRQWTTREATMDQSQYTSLRSDADTADPFSVVLFSDIQAFLLDLTSRQAKAALRMAWLSFIGLPLPGFSLAENQEADWDDRWNSFYCTSRNCLDATFPPVNARTKLLTDAVAGVIIGREKEYSSPFGPIRCWGQEVSLPLDLSSAEPGRALRRGLWSSWDVTVDEHFIRNIFSVLRMDGQDFEWHALALAFETAVNPKSAIKLSKSLLSTNREALPLWECHAQLERLRGKIDDARKIYQTILNTSKPDRLVKNVSRLWSNWAEMEWLSGDDQRALEVILKSAGVDGPASGINILRAKRFLEDAAVAVRPLHGWKEQEGWVKLRALLELLTGNEAQFVFDIFDKYADEQCDESFTTASLVMAYSYGFVLKRPMPPSILRERAHAAFEKYSSNSIILGILLETEKGQGVWGRIRGMLGSSDGKAKSVARRIEEVWIARWESGRWESEIERTRSGLAAAVEHERTRASPVIWRIYIEFEIRVKDLRRAKTLLFRAIGECPLVKELYLLAFGPLRSVFVVHELKSLGDSMVERGLRLHAGLEELMDVEEAMEDKGSSEASEDEIEHNAKELRRLKPY